jgi:hypothetical protein
MTAPTPTTAAEVLAAHQRNQVALIREADQSLWIGCQGCAYQGPIDRPWTAHQADALREAGLLVAEIVAETGPGAPSGAGAGGNATRVIPGRETGA